VHVFDPANYPYAPSHAYSPGVASYCSLLAFEGNLSADGNAQNIVLVQPSPYGTDNSLILHLLAKHTKENREMRAIAVIDPERVTDVELKMMQQLGVRGIRVNAETTAKQVDFMKLKLQILASANRVSRYRHWKCQLFLSGDNWKRKKPFSG
jgi:predicted TIM-barrel fold metal-dependent hydrolase